MKPFISVIIPTYNYTKYLPYTVQSALDQKSVDLEILVIDDGSTEDVPGALKQFGSAVQIIRQENQGTAAARNTGFRHMTGDFGVMIDSDDLFTPNVLYSQFEALEKESQAGMAVCFNQLVTAPAPQGPFSSAGTWPLFRASLGVHLCHFNIMPIHAVMLRRETIRQTGFYDTELPGCEDYEYWLRCAVNNFFPVINPNGLVLYRKHLKSLSHRREHRYDAALHEIVHNLLLSHPEFLSSNRIDAWIAHASGCLVTALKDYQTYENQAHKMFSLCNLAIKQAAKEYVTDKTKWVRTTESDKVLLCYVARLLNYLDTFINSGQKQLEAARDIICKLFPEWQFRPSERQKIEIKLIQDLFCKQLYIQNFTTHEQIREQFAQEALTVCHREKEANGPQISVVVATRNAEKYLERCLNSVLTQKYSKKEVVVQDGASTDRTQTILKKYESTIQWESEPDTGVYDAWNKALLRVTGDWALFLGADDFLFEDSVLARCAEHLRQLPDEIVFAYGVLLQGKEGKISYIFNRSLCDVFTTFTGAMGLPFPATFVRVPFLKSHSFNTAYKIAGDFELAARTVTFHNVARLPVCVAFMEVGGLSTQEQLQHSLLQERKKILTSCVLPRSQEFISAIIESQESQDRSYN